MATQVEAPTAVTVTKTERTWRATVETPRGAPYSLQVHREVAITDSANVLVAPCVRDRDYSWSFDEIQNINVTISGVTMTVAQIAGFMQAAFDQLVAAKKAAEITP